jgi:hypothetical protein
MATDCIVDYLKYEMPEDLRAWECTPTLSSYSRSLQLELHGEVQFASPKDCDLPSLSPAELQTEITVPFKHLEMGEAKKLKGVFPRSCPSCPYYLMPTNFNISLNEGLTFADMIDIVDATLSCMSEYDFSYDEVEFLWRGKYLQGSSCCLLEVRIYSNNFNSAAYIIESNRTNGESRPFHKFFQEFKVLLSQTDLAFSDKVVPSSSGVGSLSSSRSSDDDFESLKDMTSMYDTLYGSTISSKSVFSSNNSSKRLSLSSKRMKTSHNPLTSETFLRSIQPILKMTHSPYFETKLEAAKMLCDFTTSYDQYYLCSPACIEQVVAAVESLLLNADGFEAVREQAIMIIALYVEYAGYEQRIIQSDVILSIVLSYIKNPYHKKMAYETAQIRRECGRIFYLLVLHNVKIVFQQLVCKQKLFPNQTLLIKWLSALDNLMDFRLKSYALKAREIMLRFLTNSTAAAAASK